MSYQYDNDSVLIMSALPLLVPPCSMAVRQVLLLLSLSLLQARLAAQGCREHNDNCTQCLTRAGQGCGWCLDEKTDKSKPLELGLSVGCVSQSVCSGVWFTKNKEMNKIEDATIASGNRNHIRPQKIEFSGRPNVKEFFISTFLVILCFPEMSSD